jgi:hypothetical protein
MQFNTHIWYIKCTAIVAIMVLLVGCVSVNVKHELQESTADRVYQMLTGLQSGLRSQAQNLGPPFNSVPAAQPLESNLDRINSSIEFQLAFYIKDLFLVDPHKTGLFYGCETNHVFKVGRKEKYSDGMAWVLPFSDNGKQKSLILMSCVAPKQTRLLLIDDQMRSKLLYDSYLKPHGILKPHTSGIDYLCGVRELDSNHFLLYEGWIPSISQVSPFPRTFLLTINEQGQIEISLNQIVQVASPQPD